MSALIAGDEYWLNTGCQAIGCDVQDGWERFTYHGTEAGRHKFVGTWDGATVYVSGEITLTEPPKGDQS